MELKFSINLFHWTTTLPIYGWSEISATAVSCGGALICDCFLSIKRSPGCLGIVLCLISIWQNGWVNTLWISVNPLYSWASSVWAGTVKTMLHSVKEQENSGLSLGLRINPSPLTLKTQVWCLVSGLVLLTDLILAELSCADWSLPQCPALWLRLSQAELCYSTSVYYIYQVKKMFNAN